MKKSAKLKKYGLAAAALPVGLAVMLTGFSFVNSPSYAAAAEAEELFTDVVLADKCDYGDSFKVPASGVSGVTPVVTAPNGKTVELGTLDSTNKYYTVSAEQLGNYTVTYKNGDESYTHNVYVTLDEDYFLRVDDNGAGIPTYMAKSGEFTVPGAKIAYYDDDSMLKPYPGEIELTVKDSANNEYEPGDKFTPAANCKTYLTYSAQMGGENGRKFFSKTFEINVQSTFSDTQAPTLSVSGVASDISINRAVKLPVATATDNYDENVKIEITVLGPDGEKVKLTDTDDYGYAKVEAGKEYGNVEFDNDKAMTFYPTEPGAYKVSYVATDDANNKSAVREYTMTAKDVAAPVFHAIADDNIPDTWGLEVVDATGNAVTEKGGKVKFPIPTLVDNVSRVGDEENPISLYFRITDSDNSRTIVEFEDVLAGGDKAKFSGKTYGKETDGKFPDLVWGEDGLDFDFSLYNRTDSSGAATEDLSGTYTVYYRASDKAQNRSSKTYTIKLEDTYEDKAAPSTAEVTAPAYLSAVADKTFTVPSPAVADASDFRPTVDYRLYSDNGLTDDAQFIKVKGGEEAEFETRSDGTYLVVDKDKTTKQELKLGTTVYYVVSVTDKVGNTKTNLATEGNYTTSEAKTRIVAAAASATGAFSYTGNIAFAKKVTTPVTPPDSGARDTAIEAGDTVVAGGFTIDVNDPTMRKLTGFEVTVKNPSGDVVNTTLDTVSVETADSKAKIYVSNITFKASVEGAYRLTVKVFDANGVSSAYGYSVDVAASSTGGGVTAQAATIGSRANVNVKYQLHNDTIDIKDDDVGTSKHYYVARRITGGSFSLIGSEFTAHTNGSYSVRDGYIASEDITTGYDFDNATPFGKGAYSFSAQDDAAPVIEVQGIMPTYADKGAEVKLPFVIASSANGKADVKVVVKNEKAKEVKVEELSDDDEFEYMFKGTTDGKYTVTYTATYANATPVTATYTINIGDVEGPEFTVKGGTAASARMRVGDTFNFADMELTAAENNVTITKKLFNPSREEVTEATVSGSYDSHKNDKYNGYDSKDKESPIKFTMAGQYEVVYTATDSVGNVTTQRYNITVVSSGSGKPTTITTLSTVLIVVAVVLLAGVIVYVVRFRKVKVKK